MLFSCGIGHGTTNKGNAACKILDYQVLNTNTAKSAWNIYDGNFVC